MIRLEIILRFKKNTRRRFSADHPVGQGSSKIVNPRLVATLREHQHATVLNHDHPRVQRSCSSTISRYLERRNVCRCVWHYLECTVSKAHTRILTLTRAPVPLNIVRFWGRDFIQRWLGDLNGQCRRRGPRQSSQAVDAAVPAVGSRKITVTSSTDNG